MTIDWQDYIEQRKDVMMGKPVFKGTRLTVEHILTEIGSGMNADEVLASYPQLRPEHLRAALLYSAAVIGMEWLETHRDETETEAWADAVEEARSEMANE